MLARLNACPIRGRREVDLRTHCGQFHVGVEALPRCIVIAIDFCAHFVVDDIDEGIGQRVCFALGQEGLR